MSPFAIILAFIILFAMLRFGLSFEYSIDGINVRAQVGFISINIFPRTEKRKKTRKKRAPKKEKKLKLKEETKTEKPGGLKEYLDLLPTIKKTFGRVRRRLLIKVLTIHYIAGDKDPSKTAMAFGSSNLVFAAIVPIFENAFKIKHREFRASADFEATRPMIYAKVAFSIAIWESFYIAFAIVPALIKTVRKTSVKPKPKPMTDKT